jgi:hypothetical protein
LFRTRTVKERRTSRKGIAEVVRIINSKRKETKYDEKVLGRRTRTARKKRTNTAREQREELGRRQQKKNNEMGCFALASIMRGRPRRILDMLTCRFFWTRVWVWRLRLLY